MCVWEWVLAGRNLRGNQLLKMKNELRNSAERVRLQPTDWKWLSALEVYGVLGLGQLNGLALPRGSDQATSIRLFFNETVKRDHWRGRSRRVVKLAKHGYLKAHQLPHQATLFTLTERGHEALKQAGLARLPGFRHRISDALATHELTANAVGLMLAELLGLEVLTARERAEWKGRGGRPATDSRIVPDLWIADDAEPKGVEIERGQKSKEEYGERWRTMRLILPENGLLLYLTGWPGGKRFILELAQHFRAGFVLVAELGEFRQGRGRCRFVGYEPGRSVVLRPAAVPYAGAASQRVPPAGQPARQDVSAGGGPAAGPFAPPSQRVRVGTLTPPLARRGQSAAPLASDARPHPLPLPSPSPSPEGDPTAGDRPAGGAPRTTGGMDQ